MWLNTCHVTHGSFLWHQKNLHSFAVNRNVSFAISVLAYKSSTTPETGNWSDFSHCRIKDVVTIVYVALTYSLRHLLSVYLKNWNGWMPCNDFPTGKIQVRMQDLLTHLSFHRTKIRLIRISTFAFLQWNTFPHWYTLHHQNIWF